MKKLGIFLMAMICTTTVQFAQNTPGLFKFSMSELAGNMPMKDGKGYVFNFNSGPSNNCAGQNDGPINRSSSLFETKIDSANGYITLKQLFYYSTSFYSNYTIENCSYYSNIDLTDNKNQVIELRVKANMDIQKFYPSLGALDEAKDWFIPVYNQSFELKADEWTVLKMNYPIDGFYDPATKTAGIVLTFENPIGYSFNTKPVEISIDYVKVGSAVDAVPANIPYNSYSAASLESNYCNRFLNVLNNPAFEFTQDPETKAVALNQLDNTSTNQYVANIFSDSNCLFSFVDFSDPTQRNFNVSIMPETDIPYFAVDINGYTTKGIWDVGKVTNYTYLKGGEWNEVIMELNLETPNGTYLDPKRITGYGLLFDDVNKTNQKANQNALSLTSNSFKIKDIKAGAGAKANVATSLDLDSLKDSFSLYPNPTSGKITLTFPGNEGMISLFDQYGVEVLSGVSVSSDEQIELSIKDGLYIVRLVTTNGKVLTKTLLKK